MQAQRRAAIAEAAAVRARGQARAVAALLTVAAPLQAWLPVEGVPEIVASFDSARTSQLPAPAP